MAGIAEFAPKASNQDRAKGPRDVQASKNTPTPSPTDLTKRSSSTDLALETNDHIPSINETSHLVKRILHLKLQLEEKRLVRAVVDRRVGELENLRDKSSSVVEASIWKHIYACYGY
jgi:hypothetical protein